MVSWDERFRAGEYPEDPAPSPVLERYVDSFPDGRALDVATGTGRNAVFLAERGYRVDGLDQSREGLRIAEETARDRSVADRTTWIQADVSEHVFPTDAYEVVTISFFHSLDRLTDIKESLVPGGVLFYQGHLRCSDQVDIGPSSDRYRFAANELLHACLDLTVLFYEESTEQRDGRRAANATVIARNSTGSAQTYPQRPEPSA